MYCVYTINKGLKKHVNKYFLENYFRVNLGKVLALTEAITGNYKRYFRCHYDGTMTIANNISHPLHTIGRNYFYKRQ